ncbi:hypothetical protein ACFQZO_24380 [Bradyrhizobium sp. GCM10027634]|uniref:hypothetical protein n=1 Tax=unclassified Bradyrhizobium TaxID=2631580 RepID=UPI00263A61BE|nr:hypothetical protein [Bradyrhizobium sp. WYCCWR 12677]MDN5003979.1 hypothetical protein [Bradyrhizobium sp. WYCCWR 12677]
MSDLLYDLSTPEGAAEYIADMTRPINADELPAIRKRQADFLREFGEFDGSLAPKRLWVGSSPDGSSIGFLFMGKEDERTRVAIPTELIVAFARCLDIALTIAIERRRTSCETAGSA